MGRGADPSKSDLFTTNLADTADEWQVTPLNKDDLIRCLGKEHRDISTYIGNTLGDLPLCIKLKKKTVGGTGGAGAGAGGRPGTPPSQEKYRAQVFVGSYIPPQIQLLNKKAQKLRSVWSIKSNRLTSSTQRQDSKTVLTKSYEESAVDTVPQQFVLEVFLPKTKTMKKKKGGNPLVVYSIPMGGGTTNPKSKVSQSCGKVIVYPNGRKKSAADLENDEGIEVGKAKIHLYSAPSLIDWTWAKGRKVFWTAGQRSAGLV